MMQEIVGPGNDETPRETLYRLCGPYWINGMRVWRIFNLKTREKLGEDFFLYAEARRALSDIVVGKTAFYFRNIPFRRTNG